MSCGKNFIRRLSAVVVAIGLSNTVLGQLPVTQLRSLYPPAASVGATASVEVLGSAPLEDVERLVFSHPGISANVVPGESQPITGETLPAYGKFTLAIAGDLAPGFYEAWAVGRHGVSHPRVFWVAPKPVIAAPQPGNDTGPFPVLSLDNIVVDRYAAARVQRYDLPLAAGQRVRVHVLDARLDSRALSNLRVLAPNGRLLASARSEGTNGALVEITAEQAGNYRVELRDGIYRGGDEFFYAVLVDPAEARVLEPAKANWPDRAQLLAALQPATGQLTPAQSLAAATLKRWLSADSNFYSLPAPRAEPLEVALPCVVHGTFSAAAQGEAFQFTAKKGEVYWFDVASDSLGESTDCYLSLWKVTPTEQGPTSTRLVEQDDAAANSSPPLRIVRRDPSLRWEAPEDATYRVLVRDQLATSNATAGRKYILAVRRPQPALDLVAAWAYPTNNQPTARPIGNDLLVGGSVAMRVIALRSDGLAGPIEVSCEGLPAGVVAPPIIIPADRDEGHLIVSCPAPTPAALASLKIVGKSLDPANPIQTEAMCAAVTWEAIPSWNSVVSRLSQKLMLFVNDKDQVPVTFQVATDAPLVMARGGKLPIPITVTRRAGGAEAAVLRAQGLPPKTTLADVSIAGNVNEAKPELVIAADAPSGQWSLWFQTETKVKFRNNPQALERAEATKATLEKIQADPARAAEKDAVAAALKTVTDRITQLKDQTGEKDIATFLPTNSFRVVIVDAPLEPAAAWRIEAKRGTESDHALTIKRLFGLDSAVDIKLEPASAGVELTAPPIAAGMDQTTAHLKLAADAAPGERPLQLKVTYKFNNQDLSANLPLVLSIVE